MVPAAEEPLMETGKAGIQEHGCCRAEQVEPAHFT